MKKHLVRFLVAALGAAAVSAAAAESTTPESAAASIEPLGSTNLNRFGLSYRMGFNITAQFRNLGGYTALSPLTNPLRTPNGDPFNYDNGYIYPDTTPGHPNFTWYYGYTAGTAMRPGGAPTEFDLSRSSSPADVTSSDNSGNPEQGLELTYTRQFGKVGRAYWGLEAGVSWEHVNISDNRTLYGAVVRNTDTFRTGGGAVLKDAPFEGTADGPAPDDPTGWPLVGLNPVASSAPVYPGAALITGQRDFEASMVNLRLGPYLDMPMGERWHFELSGGLALLHVHSDFSYSQTVTLDPTVTIVPLPSQSQSGSGSHGDWLVGAYLGGTFSYAINDRVRLFAGAQWQYTGNYTQNVGGKEAVLELGGSVYVPIGISFSF